MRIPRPVRRKPEFRRRGSPPPAARKLLIASLSAGLVLLVMLAIVFIPRGLPYEGLLVPPRVAFESNMTGGTWRVVVSLVTIVRPLSEYRANYTRGGVVLTSIDPLNDTAAGNANMRFQDIDGDGNLGPGDEFQVTYTSNEVLRLVWTPGGAIVGVWPTQP